MKISLVLATVGRTTEVERFLRSLEQQTCRDMELIVVDQNEDDRLNEIISTLGSLEIDIVHLRLGDRNLSKARNFGIARARHEVVGFPDDDCWYEKDLVEVVLANLNSHANLDAIVGRW